MRCFECDCGARTFFDNVACLKCGRELGFVPDLLALAALEPTPDGTHRVARSGGAAYRKCDNYAVHNVCNWMVPASSESKLCRACELNRIIPDLSKRENQVKWGRIEAAKRRLIYTIDDLGLPLTSKSGDPVGGIAFDIKADTESDVVMTGHQDGVVTIKLDEADPVTLEKTRVEMHESYRSLLGHFRHESGHYYFNLLLRDGPDLTRCRELFGDERADYAAALQRHYDSGVAADSSCHFVSNYASVHPSEDWAETWAHYLHMLDTLETAQSFGTVKPKATTFDELLANWLELTVVLNALNRSMGLDDAYPFQIGDGVRQKLEFVHYVAMKASASRCSKGSIARAR